MKTILRRLVCCLLCSQWIAIQSYAQATGYLGVPQGKKAAGAEYISGNEPGSVHMKVNLWGAVRRPGIHHVPVRTDLMALFSYAGGPTALALLDEVTIKRQIGNKRKLIKVDVEELIQGVSHHQVELSPNDIIVVPQDKPIVSQDTLTIVTLISAVISTVVAVTVIQNNTN